MAGRGNARQCARNDVAECARRPAQPGSGSARESQCHERRLPVVGRQCERQGDLIVISFHGNAFLHHMVRNIVGALIFVGLKKKSPDWIAFLIKSCDRSLSAPTFMPDGLYLAKIDYDKKWNIISKSVHNFPDFLPFLEE